MAISALRMRASVDVASYGYNAIPILADILIAKSSIITLLASSLLISLRVCCKEAIEVTFSTNTKNSSPLWRPNVASSPKYWLTRSVILHNSLSPTAWPKESLTGLNLSKSINITAHCESSLAALVMAFSIF